MALRFLLALALANGAVPPLSDTQREELATTILVGKFSAISTTLAERREGHVDNVFTGEFSAGDEGATRRLTWWKAKTRPAGWTGHQGQQRSPHTESCVRVFLDEHGQLLVPNGWAPSDACELRAPAAAAKDTENEDAAATEPPVEEQEQQQEEAAPAEPPVEEQEQQEEEAPPAKEIIKKHKRPNAMPMKKLAELFRKLGNLLRFIIKRKPKTASKSAVQSADL